MAGSLISLDLSAHTHARRALLQAIHVLDDDLSISLGGTMHPASGSSQLSAVREAHSPGIRPMGLGRLREPRRTCSGATAASRTSSGRLRPEPPSWAKPGYVHMAGALLCAWARLDFDMLGARLPSRDAS
jgi:hypothetical protein